MKKDYLSFLTIFFSYPCHQTRGYISLSEEQIVKYITVYKNIKKLRSEFINYPGRNSLSLDQNLINKAGYEKREVVINAAGLTDNRAFVQFNQGIGIAINFIESGNPYQQMENTPVAMLEITRENLNNLEINELERAEIQNKIAEIQKVSQEEYKQREDKGEKKKKIFQPFLEITNKMVNEQDKALIKKNRKEFLEKFSSMRQQ
jgi:hypothetical protein